MSLWTAASDRDYADETHGPFIQPNATCPQCRADFYKGRHDTGDLCDRCCRARDVVRTAYAPRTEVA